MNNYMKKRNVSEEVQLKVKNYIENVHKNNFNNIQLENQLISAMND